jgi:hypothetical protein
MLRNKGTDPITLSWNSKRIILNPSQTLDVAGFGVEGDKDKSILEDRFIAKYPDSIEKVIEKVPQAKNESGPTPGASSLGKVKSGRRRRK